jgi:uncharacterized SAM-binding protein YcdF (DUF218 family)
MKQQIFNWQKKVIIVALITIGFLATTTWPGIIFYPMGAVLYRNDHPEKNADAVLILMGEPEIRPEAATKAVLSGMSDKIIFVTPQISPLEEAGLRLSEDDLTIEVIKKNGFSLDKVIVIRDFGRSTSTFDESIAISKFIDKTGIKLSRLIVVTSWPHTSRAGWILEKGLAKKGITVEMLPVERIPFDKSNWWQSERGLIFVFEEYIKWARYLAKYSGRDIT